MYRHIVPEGVQNTPLNRYLTRAFPCLPGWLIRETLKKKDVRIDGIRSGADASVCAGNVLTLYLDARYFAHSLTVIYEDDSLLVVEKPTGIPSDSDQNNIGADTMSLRIRSYCPEARLCHRLDTGTGGVLIAAKTERAQSEMSRAFRQHLLSKKYLCLVVGTPRNKEEKLTAYLLKNAASSRVRIIHAPQAGALPIETHYKWLDEKNGLSLLEVTLITGRTHQIRAHLSSIGLPLIGDDKYGDRAANQRFGRTQPALWCSEIRWKNHVFQSTPPFLF